MVYALSKTGTHIVQWHYMNEEPPKKPGFYQVAVEACVTYMNHYANKDGKGHIKKFGEGYAAICYWDGGKWCVEVNDYSLEVDAIGGPIGANDTIYACADALLSIPKVKRSGKSITISPADYHLTNEQLKALLQDYKDRCEATQDERR